MKIVNVFLLFVFLIKACFVAANSTQKVNQMLLDNLFRYYAGFSHEDLEYQPGGIPMEIINSTFAFTGMEGLQASQLVSKSFASRSNEFIRFRLRYFSPHLVFEADWFNLLVLQIIFDTFPLDARLKDPETPDYLALLTLKYILNENGTGKRAPKYVYLAILSYLHEIVFGSETRVPIKIEHFHYFYAETVQNYPLPRTKARFFALINDNGIYNGELKANMNTIFEFLESRPSRDEKTRFYYTHRVLVDNCGSVFKFIFKEAAFPKQIVSVEQIRSMLVDMSMIDSTVSTRVFNYIRKTENLSRKLKSIENNRFFKWIFHELEFPHNPVREYIRYAKSIDHNNPFHLSTLLELLGNYSIHQCFYDIAEARIPYHYKLDILTKILQSGLLKLNDYNGTMAFFIAYHTHDSTLGFFELLCRESPTLINLKNYYSGGRNLIERFNERDFATLIETQTSFTNPLPSIFFYNSCSKTHPSLKSKFVYNLSVLYRFEDDFSAYTHNFSFQRTLKNFAGRTLPFRQILNEINHTEMRDDLLENEPVQLVFAHQEDDEDVYIPTFSAEKYFEEGTLKEVY